jgi:hypothetical protein
MIDFSSIKFDKSILSNIQGINPYEIFGKLGLTEGDTNKILQGDFSPVSTERPFIIDYDIFFKNYGSYFNTNLIKYFFRKAKDKEELSDDEWYAYNEAYEYFFELAFKIGSDGIFAFDPEDTSIEGLFIQVEGSTFVLARSPLKRKIYYLEHTTS